MERAVCEHCGHWQPADWAAGDLCVACGAAVRREVRCAWCAEWIPAGRFCRSCGCEVLGPEEYGAARMLKSAGVDRFSMAQRLRELDPEQIANLGRIYNAQLAVVARRVEELRLCERHLLQKGFSRRLEEELVPRLPVEKEALAALAAGPAGPFEGRTDLLPEIAERSPIELTRMLASIARLRMGCFEKTFPAARQGLQSPDPELALEAALAFAHWRVRLYPYSLWRHDAYAWWSDGTAGIERPRLAEVAGAVPRASPLRSWAAAAVTLARYGEYGALPEADAEESDWLRSALRDGLASRDPDLRFTCAMALPELEIVSRALHSEDAQQKRVARTYLARHQSPAIAPYLIEGPDEVRQEVLEDLRDPLPDALVEPVLHAVEQGGPQIRERGTRLLLPSLTQAMVDRLVRLALRQSDTEVFRVLLTSERLPASQGVIRAIIQAGLFEELYGRLYDAPEHVDFTDEAVLQLAAAGPAGVLEKLIAIAERQLQRRPAEAPASIGVARFFARVAFGAGPAEIRTTAYQALDGSNPPLDWVSSSGMRQLFGNPEGFFTAVLAVLKEAELQQLSYSILDKLSSRWEELAGALAEARAILPDFVVTLADVARGRFHRDTVLQGNAAQLLVKTALVFPAAAAPTLAALLRDCGSAWQCRDVPGDLLAEYSTLARQIGGQPALAAELADGLVAMLAGETTLDRRYIPAIELLAKLAQDHDGLRKPIGGGMAQVFKDRDFVDRDVREALALLANAIGWQPEPETVPEDQAPEEDREDQAALDHLVVFPGTPLPALADYVAFLKAMGTTGDPMAVMAGYGLTVESYVECVTRWGEALGASDALALRYAKLVAS